MQVKIQYPIKRFIAFALMMIIAIGSVVSVMAVTVSAKVIDGDTEYTVNLMMSTETDDIIAQAGLELGENDLVSRSDGENGIVVTIRRELTAWISADDTTKAVKVHYGDTVAEALRDAGVSVGLWDNVEPGLSEPITQDGTVLTIARKMAVRFTADGSSFLKILPTGTVEDAIEAAGLTLGEEDIVNYSLNRTVEPGMDIAVNRVTYQEVTTEEEIPYDTIEESDSSMTVGNTQVKTAGQNGSQTVVTRNKLVDGKVVSSEVVSTTVNKEPVDEVVLVGSKAPSNGFATITGDGTLYDQNGNLVNYSSYLTGRCCAYTSNGGYTSTGAKAQRGLIAVNPNIIPYGTKLYICSPDGSVVYGYATAADTGGGVMNNLILADLYYDTESECVNFGVRDMRIYILS